MSDASLLWYFYFYLSEFNFIQTSLWLFSIWSSDGKKVSCNKRRRNDEQTLLMDLRLHLPEESPKLSAARRLFHRIFSSSNKNTQSTKSFIFQHKQQLDHRIDLFLNNLIVPNWYVWNMIWMIQIYPNDLKKHEKTNPFHEPFAHSHIWVFYIKIRICWSTFCQKDGRWSPADAMAYDTIAMLS